MPAWPIGPKRNKDARSLVHARQCMEHAQYISFNTERVIPQDLRSMMEVMSGICNTSVPMLLAGKNILMLTFLSVYPHLWIQKQSRCITL